MIILVTYINLLVLFITSAKSIRVQKAVVQKREILNIKCEKAKVQKGTSAKW